MKAAITGVSHFVGFHLAQRLLRKGHSVVGLSRHRNGWVRQLQQSRRFQFISGSVTDPSAVSRAVRSCRAVFHLAAVSSERWANHNRREAFETNVLGTLTVLEEARRAGVKKMVFASSAAVYPDLSRPKRESDAATVSRFYGMTKQVGESVCRLYHEAGGVSVAILRMARIYGPGMERNPVYDTMKAFSEGTSVRLYESLRCRYDFVFVSDVVDAFLAALSPRWGGRAVNIGSGRPVTLARLIRTAERVVEPHGLSPWGEILSEPTARGHGASRRVGRPARVVVAVDKTGIDTLDVRLARRLKWRPRTSLESGLKRTWRWFQDGKL